MRDLGNPFQSLIPLCGTLKLSILQFFDEKEGRITARQLNIPVIGVLGVLLRAKKLDHITHIKPEIERLKSRAGFFIEPRLEASVLNQAGE